MSSIVIDSNVLIDVMNGCGDYAARLGKADEVLVPLIVLGEPLAEETVGFYASVRRQLKRAGTPIPQNDIWIAAQTLEHGAALCTRDADFKAVANLRLVPEGLR